jgi:hypothetical protein
MRTSNILFSGLALLLLVGAASDPEPAGGRYKLTKIQLPSEADVDWAMDYVQRMMRKFKDRMRDFKDNDRRNL